MTKRRHYTIDDIDCALEDQRAELAIWRREALCALRARLLAQDEDRRATHSARRRGIKLTAPWKS